MVSHKNRYEIRVEQAERTLSTLGYLNFVKALPVGKKPSFVNGVRKWATHMTKIRSSPTVSLCSMRKSEWTRELNSRTDLNVHLLEDKIGTVLEVTDRDRAFWTQPWLHRK